ncbi:MAG: iron-sulfur cluster repair di-iron protein [Proteobacteria bacterium]|nr:iron-sulfur cluster repair di-iron protein [Pseudomonadota bacterium]
MTFSTSSSTEPTIGELVAHDYRKAEVFKAFGLDFCCGGKQSVRRACEKNQVDYEALQAELARVDMSPAGRVERFDRWPLAALADYVENSHHAYLYETLPIIEEFATKVARVHGENHPENIEILSVFRALKDELLAHLPKEEHILFPYMRRLGHAQVEGEIIAPPPFGTVANPIRMMEHEHDDAGELLRTLRRLSNNYTPPADACNTYKVLYAKLAELEDDVHRHIHIENNILFPESIAIEQALTS